MDMMVDPKFKTLNNLKLMKIPDNWDYCPCGSNKRYLDCCQNKFKDQTDRLRIHIQKMLVEYE
tara:strand:+ start:917 stop:1105 length:189 start_codon:yes stop_codon:yes gene_type:complete